jgi:DNA polymerase III subunit epsilon
MSICAFDTETNGLDDVIRLVEIGAVLIDDNGIERASISLIIRPDGWSIPENVSRIHGITTEIAVQFGVPLVVGIASLTNLWSVASVRVAHNLSFDEKVIATAIASIGRASMLTWPPAACTKELAAPVLNLPPTEKMLAAGYNKPKPPSLKECYQHFFHEDVPGAHGALADARACARVYRALIGGS